MIKLDRDDTDALLELMVGHGWKPLLAAVENLVNDEEQRLLKYNLEDGAEKLVHAKARVEGARRLASNLRDLKEVLKKRINK